MSEKRVTHTEEQPTIPRRWQPSKRQVLWAIGMMGALATLAILIVKIANLYPDIWQALSRERVAMLIGIGVTLVVVIVLLAIGGTSLGWTGFGNKTLWDWLQLLSALAIPVVLAAAGLWFTAQQDQRQQAIEDQRVKQAQNIETQRAEAERELAEQRAQDEALQAYLGQMSSLLLEKDLRNSKEGSEARTLARARTLTVLGRLDRSRKTAVMQFLVEAALVQGVDERDPIIRLEGADLSFVVLPWHYTGAGADLRGADLSSAVLYRTDLQGADLSGADLSLAFLNHAMLFRADLSGATLSGATLSGADLEWGDLTDTTLSVTNLSDTTLRGANLSGADLSGATLSGANLSGADLTGAVLSGANLWKADLSNAPGAPRGADLTGADLSGADLREADLSNAKGVTCQQTTQAESLEGATMPNGKKYEEWLTSCEEENSDPQ